MNGNAKTGVALMLALALALVWAGCDAAPEEENVDSLYYMVDELGGGLFGNLSPEATMNEWFRASRTFVDRQEDYDTWSAREKDFLYQDKRLTKPFAGSDMLNETSVVYYQAPVSFNYGQDIKIGEITGTITLNNIPLPDTTRIYINSNIVEGFVNNVPTNWWIVSRKINTGANTDTTATFDWSLPVYDTFKPAPRGSLASFTITVLPGDSLRAYTVDVPLQKNIGDVNENVGSLSPNPSTEVSVRGVNLSGTINITYNGEPVPYVEIYVRDQGYDLLGITCLFSPEPGVPWSVTFGLPNSNKEANFQVFGYANRIRDDVLLDQILTSPIAKITNNTSVQGIVLNVGDF